MVSNHFYLKGLSIFFIKGISVLSNGPRSLPKNSPDFPILCNWVFDYFILADELFAKALRSLKSCVLVNKNLCRRAVSSLQPHLMKDLNISSMYERNLQNNQSEQYCYYKFFFKISSSH